MNIFSNRYNKSLNGYWPPVLTIPMVIIDNYNGLRTNEVIFGDVILTEKFNF